MLLEHPQQMQGAARQIDVCVIGSGPAGMTLALALERKGLRVLVLEAGGVFYDEKSQAYFEGAIVGEQRFDLAINRLRYFGGCSNHWGGFCRMLEDWDFRDKVEGVPGAWPITRSDLDPYLDAARDILELPCFPEDQPLNDMVTQVHWGYSPTVNFSIKYRAGVRASKKLHVLLNACVTQLVEKDGRIVAVEVSDPELRRYSIQATQFVLCAGGVENSRILLWANEKNEGRLFGQNSALGKYWMEHPHFTIGDALVYGDPRIEPDRRSRSYLAPTIKAIRERKILNCGLRLERTDYDGTKRLIADLACVAPTLGRWAIRQTGKHLVCGMRIRAAWEQAPRESNQIRLAKKRDALGIPQVELHWKFSDLELHTVRQMTLLLGEYLISKNYGRVRLLPWVADGGSFPADDEQVGNHHMGGTRMSKDPRHGVVDAQCKVHAINNLYVGGSSVFPSGGHANPTLTIVQLALRLADHLAARAAGAARA